MRVEVRNLDEVTRALRDMPIDLFPDVRRVFQQAVLGASNKTKQNATSILNVRSGHLKQSINQEVTGTRIGDICASVYSASVAGGSPVKYARVHEFGAQGGDAIRAIDKYLGVPGGPYLNIPLPGNKTPAGVTRRQAREVFASGGYIRQSRAGNWIVFDGDSKPMFYLTKSVEIPARLGMRDAAADEVPTLLSRLAALIE